MNENNNNENKVTETTFTEAIVTGWQHPIMGATMVNQYDAVASIVGMIKMILTWVAMCSIIFTWIFCKAAKDQNIQIKDKATGKWCFWNKALKQWLPKD